MAKRIFKKIYLSFNLFFRLLNPFINLLSVYEALKNYPNFLYHLFIFRNKQKTNKAKFKDLYPCLNDNTNFTSFDRHYIYHPAWAARIIAALNPVVHYDISSTLNFCTMVSAFVPVNFYDYRPAKLNLSNLQSAQIDLIKLHFETNSIQSLSCMHTIEHIGLGRYGDNIDTEGDKKAINELKRVTAIGGNLLIVVPVGRPRIMFNAHRIYSYNDVIKYFAGFELINFSLVPDEKEIGFIENATKEQSDKQFYGCGCFWFRKKQ